MFHHPDHPQAHQDVSPEESTILGIGFAWELGYTIAVPAVLLGIGGGYIDTYVGSGHLFLFLGLVLAFVSSSISIARRVRIILARMPKVLPKKKPQVAHPDIDAEQQAIHDLFRPPAP
jgi:F0F1-type ATP synthase assembly protein I